MGTNNQKDKYGKVGFILGLFGILPLISILLISISSNIFILRFLLMLLFVPLTSIVGIVFCILQFKIKKNWQSIVGLILNIIGILEIGFYILMIIALMNMV